MHSHLTRRQFFGYSAATVLTVSATGCGTLRYPERVGQARGGFDDVDWTIAGMDAIGLVFFFVPGVIAFAIDYHNGTLFYPPGQYGNLQSTELHEVALPAGEPSISMIEQTISNEIGQPVQLEKENFVARKLSSIKHFWRTYDEVSTNA